MDACRREHPNLVTHPGFTWPASNPHATVSELSWAPETDQRDRIDCVFHCRDSRLRLTDAQVAGPRETIVRNQRVVESGKDGFLLANAPARSRFPIHRATMLNTLQIYV